MFIDIFSAEIWPFTKTEERHTNVLHKIGHSERIIEANCMKMNLLYLVW